MVSASLVETVGRRCHSGHGLKRRAPSSVARSFTLTILGIGLAASLGACATKPKLPPGVRPTVEVGPAPKSDTWKAVATPADKDRLARLDLAWSEALDDANKTNPAEVRKEGKLLLPRSALPRPEPTPGSYNCRLIKLGKATPKSKAFESFKPFFCYVEVEDDLLTIVKQTGSQRPAGRPREVDEQAQAVGEPELAVLVVRQSDGLPGQGWWVGGAKKHGHTGLWDGPKAARFIRTLQRQAFTFWAEREP